MLKKILITAIVLAVLLLSAAAGQAADSPTVAIIRYGTLRTFDTTEGAILDVLESYGYISAAENAHLHTRQDLQGEKLNIIWGSANFDLPTANLMLADILDQEPDVIVTLTTAITQLTINATNDMDDPPAVIFTSVYNPYEAGIVQSSCIKPAHVTGAISAASYEEVINLLIAENPQIRTIGTLYNSSETAGAIGVQEITRIASELDVMVLAVAVTEIAEINLAAEALINRDIDAIVMPIDLRTGAAGLPIIVNLANEYGIPVFHPILFSIYYGATVSTGFYHYYAQGDNVGRMLVGYLDGDIDIATTAIYEQTGSAIGVNLDMAGRQGIELSDEVIASADAVIVEGQAEISQRVAAQLTTQGEVVPKADRQEADQAFLAQLACTPQRIAQEQAELDAREG